MTLTPTDTLNSLSSVSALGYSSVGDFAESIQGKAILGSIVLDLVWYAYTPNLSDTLGTLIDYFNTTAYELVLANLMNPNLLQAGSYTINNIPCTIQSGDTLQTLLNTLAITVDDFTSDTTNATCNDLLNTPNLLSTTGQAGILLPQSTVAFSTSELPLTQTSSYLNFILSKNEGSNQTLGENALVNLSFQVNSIQKQSSRETLPGFEDYDTLSFVIPPAPNNTLQLEIPIPLRDVPESPILLAQEAILPQPNSGLPDVKLWSYQITYTQQESSQDEVAINVAFNQKTSSAQSLQVAESHPSDLFSSLAWFICTWPALEADLNALPALSESLPLNAQIQSGLSTAVESFAQIASDIAQKWTAWKEDCRMPDVGSTNDYNCSIQEFRDSNGNFAVHIRSSNFNLPLNSYPSVSVIDNNENTWSPSGINATIMDYSTNPPQMVTLSPLPPSNSDNFKCIEVIYTNFQQGTGNNLSFTKALEYNTRQFSINNLNIVQTYNVWGSIAMSRNGDLISGQNTNPALIYRTPWVKFSSPCVPRINSSQLIDITQTPITTGNPPNQTLETYLSNLFGYLLELQQPDQASRIHHLKVSCHYSFTVGNSSVHQPVFLHPEYMFSIHDWEIQDSEQSKETFVQRMADAITAWQKEVQPNSSDGQYIFDIALLTGKPEAEYLLNFLVKNNTDNLPGATIRTKMPLSFYIPNDYWITPPNNQSDPYSVKGFAERILAYYGADIYDVATAQIALSIYPDFLEGMQVAQDWTNRLLTSASGAVDSIRGWSNGQENSQFLYGQHGTPIGDEPPGINDPSPGAYFFRMISDQYFMSDPLTGSFWWPGTTFKSESWENDDNHITWIDWKPITGENAWGAILGPLQVEYRKTGGFPDFNSNAVQLALKVIPAYQAMQQQDISTQKYGPIFYAPANTAANAGGTVDPYSVSNENNFSSFAAITALMEILSNCYINETDPNTRQQIQLQFTIVQTIAQGIQDYFQENLLDTTDSNGLCFYTGGTYADSSGAYSNTFTPGDTNFPFAVDVHTWGCTVLGIDRIDKWFSSQSVTVYSLWQTVKQRAGYFVNGDTTQAILGVGYTDVPTDPSILDGAPPHEFIISAEWTFGAITMCRVIGQQYLEKSRTADSTDAKIYANYAASLFNDAETMMNGVRNLLLDTSRADEDIYAYYYANRRYDIPFGWYSNRVDSLCSTAWGVMVQNDFNPFVLGGSYAKKVLLDPTTYTVQSWQPTLESQVTQGNMAAEMTTAGIDTDLQGLVRFLVINNTKNLQAPSSQYATGMPLSFFVANEGTPNSYWNQLSNPGSTVYDSSYSTYCTNNPISASTERVLIHYGVDIYDAATMQCALAIYPDFETGMITANSQTKRLLSGFSIPNTSEIMPGAFPFSTIRGWTQVSSQQPPPQLVPPPPPPFLYGQNQTPLIIPPEGNAGPGAYFFRSISDQFNLTDPLTQETNTWTDWKPITGENAWAALIGPLQVAFSRVGGIPTMDDEAVQLALTVLPAYQAMVSPSGGIFYCPWNMSGNTGQPADPFQLSNENNFSSLAGLRMLQTVLQHNNDQQYLPIVNQLVSGIENYLQKNLFDTVNNCFFTGGTYANTTTLLNQIQQLCSYIIGKLSTSQVQALCTAINALLSLPTSNQLTPENITDSAEQTILQTAIINDSMLLYFLNTLQMSMGTNYPLTGYSYPFNLTLLKQIQHLCSYINDNSSTLPVQALCTAINALLSLPTSNQLTPENITDSAEQTILQTAITQQYQISENDLMPQFLNTLQTSMGTNYLLTGYNYFVWGNEFSGGGSSFPFAVDVHTWGCSVLGVECVDTWFGSGIAYNMWQTVKQRAGYFVNGDTTQAILGVGYTDVSQDVPTPHESVISAEWTFGAINMCRILSAQYNNPESQYHNAQYAASLMTDAQTMMQGVQSLLLNPNSIDSYTQAYYYANRRYDIPFGWYANRIDSLCSTAWGIMVANNYNPFVLGGGTDYTQIGEGNVVYGSTETSKPSLELSGLYLSIDKIKT